ncbi:MAG: nuclear transport factor 2 family protein [Acidobacteriota bacterium]|nr:nuclear transport factor 2 family protein [Acidobacteriota bacterium]
MHANARLIESFYRSFQQRNASGMVACYHPQVEFSDNVFPHLQGPEARAMWYMLCERGKDLEIEFEGIEANETSGRAHWQARYTFSPTGRPVHNSIYACFTFEDGRIVAHRDSFDLWRWASQALGLKGRLLGWTPLVQNAIRRQAARGLKAYMSKHQEAGFGEAVETSATAS